MDLEFFALSFAVTLGVVLLALRYLRPVTRRVLEELCHRSGSGAEFWLRTSNVLAISGTLILVLSFGKATTSWVDAIRYTLILALVGVFATVTIITSSVWRRVIAINPAAEEGPTA